MNPITEVRNQFLEADMSISAQVEFVNPLQTIEVDTSTQVTRYFPQDLHSIKETVDTAKETVVHGLRGIFEIPKEKKTFANTLYAIDSVQAYLHSRKQSLWVVSMTHRVREVRDAAKEAKDELDTFLIENFKSNKTLYRTFNDAVTTIHARGDYLSEQQAYFIEQKQGEFRREGLHLEESDFEVVKTLKIELCVLESSFRKNLDEDRSEVWVTKDALDGVPQRVIEGLTCKEGKYLLTCDYPVYFPVKEHCKVEETRRTLQQAFYNRAADKNIPALNLLISLRGQLAERLGYRSFAEYDLEGQMAESPKKVQEFIDSITEAARTKANLERQRLLEELPESVTLTEEGKVKPWDFAFIKEGYKNKRLGVDEKKIQEYFPFEQTLGKLLELYSDLFELDFKVASNEGLWDPGTIMIGVYTKEDQKLAGHVILDLFPREGKFGHGYCVDVLAPTENNPAIATVLASLSPATGTTPSLLQHGEVTTLFHELGHCLHQLLGRAEMPSLAGYHVKIDFLELPSQLLEEMLWDPKILDQLGEHYQTKEKLPKELIAKKIASRYSDIGDYALIQMYLASISLHYFQEGLQKNTKKIREDLFNHFFPWLAIDPKSNYEGTFSHLADPLYRAKYYCYVWADVYAKDLYEHIQSLADKPWLKYRKDILELGGGLSPNRLLLNFLGREPSSEAYKRTLTSL